MTQATDAGSSGDDERRTVLVTGGAGFIGRNLVPELVREGWEVVVADLLGRRTAEARLVEGDLCDGSVIDTALSYRPTAVVHLAAKTSVLQSLAEPESVWRTNVDMTARLLRGCMRHQVQTFVNISTNAVVGATGGRVIDEGAPIAPLTPYGASKAAAEALVELADASMRTCSLRLTNVYGPGMSTKDSLIARLIRAGRSGQTVQIRGDGTQTRDFLHAADVAAGISTALGDPRWRGKVILGSGRSLQVREIVKMAQAALPGQIHVSRTPWVDGEMKHVRVSPAKAQSLGWVARRTLEEELARTHELFEAEDALAAQDPRVDTGGR